MRNSLHNDGFLTVSELNGLIRDVVNMGFPQAVWVCGEVQGYNRNKEKNHIFFELCEKDAASKDVVARIGLVIFSGRKAYIEEVLRGAENAFQLKDDIEVKFLCKVDFYPPHGAMRLIVESIDPVYTLGKIAQEKQKLVALLRQKGVLDKNKQLELNPVPLRIGLVSAYDSAAYNDFLAELKLSGFGFQVYFKNALMQGNGAPASVCHALDQLSRMSSLDAIVITRGGGSIAELSCFDSQLIAEKIAVLPLPVLSGIGHEINITVTDLSAHTYAKTPTAIAQFLARRVETFLTDAEEKVYQIITLAQERFSAQKTALKDVAVGLQNSTNQFLKAHSQEVLRFQEILKHQPLRLLRANEENVFGFAAQLLKSSTVLLRNQQQQLKNYERIVEIAHPVNTLKRGFSITRNSSGKAVRSIREVKRTDKVTTEIADGRLDSVVEKVQGTIKV